MVESDKINRWPNQIRGYEGCIERIARAIKRIVNTSPTGSGKTTMMIDMIQWAVEQRKSVALYTHRKMLFEQTTRVLDKNGIRHGHRASEYEPNLFLDVQLCMIQTELNCVYKNQTRALHKADLVLFDECHQMGGDSSEKIKDDHVKAGATAIGYTATPLDLGPGWDDLLVAGTMSECLKIGALVKPVTYAPDEPDLRHIKNYVVGQEITVGENVKSIMRPGVFGRVLSAWKKHNPDGLPSLLFGPDVAGSLFFAQEFWKAGIPAAHIDSNQIWINGEIFNADDESRKYLASLSQKGEVKIVCNRFVLREGIDWPWIRVGCFATVFGALTSFLQSGGRLLRAHPGKDKCIILDHGGNWHRHGSLAVDRKWELGMTNQRVGAERAESLRQNKESNPEPITCPQCHKVRAKGRECPECGFVSHKKSRVVIQVDGTLKEVVGEIYRPRVEKLKPNTQQIWERMYYRAKSVKWNATFNQARAKFFLENYYWPPRNLKLMPIHLNGWYQKVREVPWNELIH